MLKIDVIDTHITSNLSIDILSLVIRHAFLCILCHYVVNRIQRTAGKRNFIFSKNVVGVIDWFCNQTWLSPWGAFPGGSAGKEPAHAGDLGDVGLTRGSERSPEGGNGSPLWCSCLGNLMDRGAWRAAILGFPKRGPPLRAHATHMAVRATLREHTLSVQTWHSVFHGVLPDRMLFNNNTSPDF